MKKTLLIAGAFAVLAPAQAFAVAADVPFNGTVNTSCTIDVGTSGTLVANGDATVLSSKLAGGAAGTAAVTTNSNNFDLSVANPTAFATVPTGFADPVNFVAEFTAAGATTATAIPAGPGVSLSSGITNVSVDLVATNTVASFINGAYVANVTLTCQ